MYCRADSCVCVCVSPGLGGCLIFFQTFPLSNALEKALLAPTCCEAASRQGLTIARGHMVGSRWTKLYIRARLGRIVVSSACFAQKELRRKAEMWCQIQTTAFCAHQQIAVVEALPNYFRALCRVVVLNPENIALYNTSTPLLYEYHHYCFRTLCVVVIKISGFIILAFARVKKQRQDAHPVYIIECRNYQCVS